jgi:hypothetical protein
MAAESSVMAGELISGVVVDRPHRVIHVVRVVGEQLESWEIDDLVERMQQHVLSKHGDPAAHVVVVQGNTRGSFRLFGDPYSVSRVRAALFNAAVSWSPITLD